MDLFSSYSTTYTSFFLLLLSTPRFLLPFPPVESPGSPSALDAEGEKKNQESFADLDETGA